MSFTSSFTETAHAAEWLLSEAPGHQSRDKVTLISGQTLPTGRVVGQITASGKFTECDPAANDGSQVAAGVLYADTDASGGDTLCVVIARGAEVKYDDGTVAANDLATAYLSITFKSGMSGGAKTQALSELQSAGIIARS